MRNVMSLVAVAAMLMVTAGCSDDGVAEGFGLWGDKKAKDHKEAFKSSRTLETDAAKDRVRRDKWALSPEEYSEQTTSAEHATNKVEWQRIEKHHNSNVTADVLVPRSETAGRQVDLREESRIARAQKDAEIAKATAPKPDPAK